MKKSIQSIEDIFDVLRHCREGMNHIVITFSPSALASLSVILQFDMLEMEEKSREILQKVYTTATWNLLPTREIEATFRNVNSFDIVTLANVLDGLVEELELMLAPSQLVEVE